MSVEISVEINGFDELYKAVDQLESDTKEGLGMALTAFGQKIKQTIRENYVPVRTDAIHGRAPVGYYQPHHVRTLRLLRASVRRAQGGTLRASVQSSRYRERGQYLEVVISAGMPGTGAEQYAAVVHEKLSLRHVIGQAKYIEIPVALAASEMADYLASSIRWHGKLGGERNVDIVTLLNPTDYD